MDEQFKKDIHDALTWFANRASESVVYDSWSDNFSREETRRNADQVRNFLKDKIDWGNLTEEECKYMGFGKWDEESGIWLIPLWLYKSIPVGIKLYSINGEEVMFDGSNIDTDTRYGCLAFGIKPKK